MLLWVPSLHDRMADDGDHGKIFHFKENIVDLPQEKHSCPYLESSYAAPPYLQSSA